MGEGFSPSKALFQGLATKQCVQFSKPMFKILEQPRLSAVSADGFAVSLSRQTDWGCFAAGCILQNPLSLWGRSAHGCIHGCKSCLGLRAAATESIAGIRCVNIIYDHFYFRRQHPVHFHTTDRINTEYCSNVQILKLIA